MYEGCLCGKERDGDPKGKRAGHKDKINERKEQENRIMLVWRACGCVCRSQVLEIVCNFFKKKGGRVGRKERAVV